MNRMPHRPSHSWGSALWTFIHTITIIDNDEFNIQLSDSEHVIAILKHIPAIIPCHKCAQYYQEFFQSEIEGRERYERMELFDLLVKYHNQVNQKLRKPTITIEEARLLWTKTI